MAKKGGRKPSFKEIVEKAKNERPSPLKPYHVSFTASAKRVYLALEEESIRAEKAGDSSNQHCTTFRMVDEAVRVLIPADPTNLKYALHAPLRDMYRISKGRMRIAWVVDTHVREVLIMFISTEPRKEGDRSDPYAILKAMAKAGYLQSIIDDWQRALSVDPDAPIH